MVRRLSVSIVALLLLTTVVSAQDPSVAPLMRLLQSGRLPKERQPQVIEMVCKRGGAEELRFVLDQAVKPDGFEPAARLQVLAWLKEAAENRKVVPSGDLSAVAALMKVDPKAKNHDLPLATLQLASIWKVKSIAGDLQSIASQDKVNEKLRAAALQGLADIGDDKSKGVLQKLASEKGPTRLRFSAVAALTKLDVDAAAKAAANTLEAASPEDDPGPMLDAFFLLKQGSEKLAAALKDAKLSQDVAKRAVRYMYSVGRSDAELSAVLSPAAGIAADPVPPTQEECLKIAAEVTAKGNAERGEKIFRRAELSCMNCHAISRAGGQVGPELSAVGRISPPDYIVSSILNPNMAIKEQFVTRIIETVDGKVVQGIVVDRDDVRVILRKADGKTTTIPAKDIEADDEGRSLMPQGLTKFLTHQEFLDLSKFVSELGKDGAYALPTKPSIQRWRVLTNVHSEIAAEVPNVEQMREYVFDTSDDDWKPVYGMVSGKLPLAEVMPKDSAFVFLMGELEVSMEGEARIVIESTEPVNTWIDAQPFETAKEITLSLAAGRRKLAFRIQSPKNENASIRVQITKPEGSELQFDVVGGQ